MLDAPESALAAWYPTVTGGPVPAADPADALLAFVAERRDAVVARLRTRNTQTNETGRAAALLPALHLVAATAGRPLALLELGASAGLNLRPDAFRVDYGTVATGPEDASVRMTCEVRGTAPLPAMSAPLAVADRRGVDLAPIDARDPIAARWLTACVYPDLAERHARLAGALALLRAEPVALQRGDMVQALPRLAAAAPADTHLTVFHTWAVHYLAPEAKAALAAVLLAASCERPLSWIALEPRTTAVALGMAEPGRDDATILALAELRAGRRTDVALGLAHPHAIRIDWRAT